MRSRFDDFPTAFRRKHPHILREKNFRQCGVNSELDRVVRDRRYRASNRHLFLNYHD